MSAPAYVHILGTRGGLTIWKLGHCPRAPGSVGGPMRCPWYLFHRLF
ncbi:unnamed protein product [Staurois parvus]|uniref:Uncharacterized protein n=1 Tax=Staurois parvus TaxID=386267 RepID=A0ABN9BDW0_9NEOB|nr:unnamed protein product [Staurois parvus]